MAVRISNPMPEPDKPANGEVMTELRAMLTEVVKAAKGDPSEVNEKLMAENYKLRRQRDESRTGPKVGPGDVVLTGDDAKAWESYRKLGDPKELKKSLDAGQQAIADREEAATAEVNEKAGALAGLRPKLFAKLAKAEGLKLTIDRSSKDGKEIEVPYVVDGEGKKTNLADYAAREWRDDLPALKAEDRGEQRQERPKRSLPPPTNPDQESTVEDNLWRSGRYGSA